MTKFFDELVYALGDEDTSVEHGALAESSEHVVAVAGSGGRVIPLLARRPRRLTCVDTSPVQLALTEMRLAALRALSFEEYLGLLGLPPGETSARMRREYFEGLSLSTEGVPRLRAIFEANKWGPIVYQGRFERMLMKMAPIIRVLAGDRAHRIFEATTLADQRAYYRDQFPHARWTLVLFILGNAPVLNALLYRGAFPKKNIPESSFAFYRNAFEHLFEHGLARESFFLQLLFWRGLRFPEGNPLEAQASVFAAAKRGLEQADVRLLQRDLMQAIADADGGVDFCSLSDVPSFLPLARERQYLQEIRPGLRPGALVVVRGHMRVPRPDIAGYGEVTERFDELIRAERTQLWHIHAYEYGS